MNPSKSLFILSLVLLSINSIAQSELIFEDFDDHDIFNNFSGNSGTWDNVGGVCSTTIVNTFIPANEGACLKAEYSYPPNAVACGFFHSAISRNEDTYIVLNLLDLFADLKNSGGNPTNVENVSVTAFKFRARGNGAGIFNHVVKAEIKDVIGGSTSKVFTISNQSDWTEYIFPRSEMQNVDLSQVKEIVFGFEGLQNDFRTDSLYFDDFIFVTDEQNYDVSTFTDDQFLDLIEHRTFKYFLDFIDEQGFAFDRSTFSDLVSVGAIGFQLAAYCVGHKRNWANGLESRVETILANLINLPKGPGTETSGYHGFFYHFLMANTGKRKDSDVELSLYDTMLLLWGVLTCKEYFKSNDNIQTYAQTLYDAVEWSWMIDPGNNQFYLGWKPEGEVFLGHVDGYTDEALLVDILALGSTTFPVSIDTYHARRRLDTVNIGVYPNGSNDTIVSAWTGSLFNYFFADNWLNLRFCGEDIHQDYPLDIWENNRRAIQANHQYCIDHGDNLKADGDDKYTTYHNDSWGLTACDNMVPDTSALLSEYLAFGALPTQQNIDFGNPAPHLGTISIYGAASSVNFLPSEAISTLQYFYSSTSLWSSLFGLGDAYSTDPHYFEANDTTYAPILDMDGNLIIHPANWLNGNWTNHILLGIDQGPMLLSLENYRDGTIWDLCISNPNISHGLSKIYGGSCGSPLQSCTDDIILFSDEEIPDQTARHANKYVTISGQVTVQNGGVAKLKATEYIEVTGEIEVGGGSVLELSIELCDPSQIFDWPPKAGTKK